MAEARARPAPRSRGLAAAAGLVALVIVALTTPPRTLALGWLAGWLFCLSVTVGAAVWLLVAALTGGRWVQVAGPSLAALSRATPVAAVAGAGFVVLGPLIFPWWEGGGGARQVHWLNPPFFALRSVAVLLLWSGLGWLAPRRPGAGAAAAGLIAYGIGVSVAGVDWILSLDPAFEYTVIGAQLAVMQMTLAMAAVALWGLRPGSGADAGGLLLAGVLGSFYLAAMGYVVSWSGNLPEKAAWYLARQAGAGSFVLTLSFVAGVLLPFSVLLVTRLRGSSTALRWTGCSVLAGGVAQFVWLVAPGRMAGAGVTAMALAGIAAAAFAPTRRRKP
ncbi:hypothetical protein GI374_05540 [Paracoccus sp. S-4012]|uniref:hypothetical protein n=1 Tax=Paracoccus sp. S-4012 TaxID=2665648 RepID=UPI0012B0D715|nr:hypothetical protein [Paracoccus sp. S-4012]MRX49920.1 hypothetical protein [Paracoccus sp. S-4012]